MLIIIFFYYICNVKKVRVLYEKYIILYRGVFFNKPKLKPGFQAFFYFITLLLHLLIVVSQEINALIHCYS